MLPPPNVLLPTMVVLVIALAGCAVGQPSASRSASSTASGSVATMAPASPARASATPAASPLSPSAPARRTLLVDTDVAADDLVALAFLISSPSVQLVGITVSGTGEAHCAGGVDVVLRLLDRLEAPDVSVACGREAPLAGSHAFPDEWRERVDEGSGLDLEPTLRRPSASTAVDLIRSLAATYESLSVLTLGPMTNLADALLNDAGLATRLGPVFVMGGALRVPGNLVCCGAPEGNSVAEWNVYVDPHALGVVVERGLDPSLVSLDGTNQVPLTPAFAARVMAPGANAARGVIAELFMANPYMIDGSFYLWDPLAAELAAGFPIGSFSAAAIKVEQAEGPESGFTRPVDGAPNIRYLATVDPIAAEDTLLAILNGG